MDFSIVLNDQVFLDVRECYIRLAQLYAEVLILLASADDVPVDLRWMQALGLSRCDVDFWLIQQVYKAARLLVTKLARERLINKSDILSRDESVQGELCFIREHPTLVLLLDDPGRLRRVDGDVLWWSILLSRLRHPLLRILSSLALYLA